MDNFLEQLVKDDFSLVIIVIVVIVLAAPYLYIKISTILAVGKSVPQPEPAAATDNNASTYYYFMSEHCSMCKVMTPQVAALQSQNPHIIIIDINQSPELRKNFHVYGTPTLMEVRKGKIIKTKLGRLDSKKLEAFIKYTPN